MFGIGETELVIIAAFAFMLFGPDKLPGMGRTIGRALRQFRQAQEGFTQVVQSEMIDPLNEAMSEPSKKRARQEGLDEDADLEGGAGAVAKAHGTETFAERKARLRAEKEAREAAEREAAAAAAAAEAAKAEEAQAEGDDAPAAESAEQDEPQANEAPASPEAEPAEAEPAPAPKSAAALYAMAPRKRAKEPEPAAEPEPTPQPEDSDAQGKEDGSEA